MPSHSGAASRSTWFRPSTAPRSTSARWGFRTGCPTPHVAGGEAAGYVIELESGFTIYHSGDTGVFGDMELIREFFAPDLVLICIGGTFTMGPESAAYAVTKLIKPKQVIPIHYGTYPVINRTPGEFIEALGDSPVEVLLLEPGEVRKF